VLQRIEACLAQIGRDGFAPCYLDLIEGAGARQVMVFAYRADAAACLLSRNFAEGRLGARLAAQYLDGGFRDDPLRARVLGLAPGAVEAVALAQIAPAMPAAYRATFFQRPGLGDKMAVMAAGAQLRLIVNLYRPAAGQPWPDDLPRLLGRLALLHFEARAGGGDPEALQALSGRERAVCLGILRGLKSEAIAQDLGVAATSVVTYRKRAYAKLGITSRAGLFAICRG